MFHDPVDAKKLAAMRRAPSPRRASEAQRCRQSGRIAASICSISARPPVKRRSATQRGASKLGVMGALARAIRPSSRAQDFGAEPRRERPAGSGQKITDPHEAGPSQTRHGLGIDSQCRDGQGGQQRLKAGFERGRGDRLGAEPH